ncbi:glycosyl hydrolase family 76-domain-containing protein [Auriculariales sp. MPI-PUGE-AT-0066]|nr:glycosyl hydrolase family 76-domain-containing protein [Auriculariales sp. MPI-PUGE-AT-0066]
MVNIMKSLLLVATALSSVTAIDYSIPSSWSAASYNVSKDYGALNSIAQNGINVMRNRFYNSSSGLFTVGWWISGSAVSALAYKDMVASTSDNRDFVIAMLQQAKATNSNFDLYGYNDDAMWFGTAAYYAYRAYGGSDLLAYAQTVWNWVASSQITVDQAAAGKSPLRSFTIQKTCKSVTTAGGVWWRSSSSDRTDAGANVITTGLFLTLSAYLAEAIPANRTTYVNAADLAFTFIKNQLMDSNSIALDTLNLQTCGINSWYFTYNSAKLIEGATVLYHVTSVQKYLDQALVTTVAAVKTSSNWQGSSGLITEGQGTPYDKADDGREFKAIWLRALTELYRREYTNTPLKALLKAYLNIQYKALTTTATDGANDYGTVWAGPFVGPYDFSQAAALDGLVAGIEINWVR